MGTQQNSEVIKDKLFTTYILFYALGIVTLVPFDFFTTATDYWMYKFRDTESNGSYNSENRTHLQAEFTSDYSIVSRVTNAVFMIATAIFIRKFATVETRIIASLCGIVAVFVVTCIFVKVDTDSWQVGFMVVTLLFGFIFTAFCGVFLITVFEIAPKFPPGFLAILLSGQAICGMLAAVVQIISLSIDVGPIGNGLVYFGTGMVFVLITLLGFCWSMKKSHFFNFYFNKEIETKKLEVSREKLLTILKKLKYYVLCLIVSSGSTSMIHPGVTSLVLSVDKNNGNKWNDIYFGPVITFLVYSTSDYCGREAAMIIKKPKNGLILLAAGCLRLCFIPMILLCNAHPREHLPVVFDEDYAYITFIIIFAFTNGFLITLVVFHISTYVIIDQMTAENQKTFPTMYKDKFFMTYILFYGMGMTTLVPSTFFPTATDYWMYKFRETSNVDNFTNPNNATCCDNICPCRTRLQGEFVSDYSIVSHVSNIFFLVVTIIFLRKISVVKRIIGALCGAIIMFAITCLFVEVDTDSWQMGFFVATLITGFVLTAFSSVFMVTLFTMVVRFPESYLAAILSGHSICGIFAALVQIVSLSIGASSKTTGLIYFSIGTFFIFLTLIGFLTSLHKSKFFHYNLTKEMPQMERPKINGEVLLTLINKVKYYVISMIIVLGCSTMIHPAVTSLVVSVNKGNGNNWNDVYFVPVTTFLIYYTCDYLGRESVGYLRKPKNGPIILIASVIRIALVPMIMLCNAHPRSHLPVVFEDYAYIIFIIIFSFTNGYINNLCVIQIPVVTDDREKGLALILIVVVMIVSLGACSFLSAVMVKSL